jgi:hypothetical protein
MLKGFGSQFLNGASGKVERRGDFRVNSQFASRIGVNDSSHQAILRNLKNSNLPKKETNYRSRNQHKNRNK